MEHPGLDNGMNCVIKPSGQRYVIIYDWAIEYCAELKQCAKVGAALISFFGHYHDFKLEERNQRWQNDERQLVDLANDTDLYQRHSMKYIEQSIQTVGKKDSIIKAKRFLIEKGILSEHADITAKDPHSAPNNYLFKPDSLNQWIIDREQDKLPSADLVGTSTPPVGTSTIYNNNTNNTIKINTSEADNKKNEEEDNDEYGPVPGLPYTLSEVSRDLNHYLAEPENIEKTMALAGRKDLSEDVVLKIAEELVKWFGRNNKRLYSWGELREWFTLKWVRDYRVTKVPTKFEESDIEDIDPAPVELFAIRNHFRHMSNFIAEKPAFLRFNGISGKEWKKIVPLATNGRKRVWLKEAVMKVSKEKFYSNKFFNLTDAIIRAYDDVLKENNIIRE